MSVTTIGFEEFQSLMQSLANAWCHQEVDAALDCFTSDALYMEPPDIQICKGHEQLRPYFASLEPGTIMKFNNLFFNEETQIGAGEYTFGMEGQPTADQGVAVLELRDGKIAFWREYQQKGPASFQEFMAPEGKKWQWHIGNYP